MKTPEQWQSEYKDDILRTRNREKTKRELSFRTGDFIRAVQLDAIKEGMSRAGRICEEQAIQYEDHLNSIVCKGCQKAIIEERNGLEKL